MSRKTIHIAGTSLHFVTLTVDAIVMILPFAYMVSTAFKPQAYVLETPPKFIPDPGMVDNSAQTWTTQDFSRYALNSALVSMMSTVLAIWLPSMTVYALVRSDSPCKEWFFRALPLDLMIPSMMLIIPQSVLMKQLHLIDDLQAPMLFYVSGDLASNTFLLRSFSEGIPREPDEAMEVGSANVRARYRRLATPLARPALAMTAIFTFLATWDEFTWALTVISTETKRTLLIAIQLSHGQNSTQWRLVSAASLVAILPIIAVYLISQHHFAAGPTAGAVKR